MHRAFQVTLTLETGHNPFFGAARILEIRIHHRRAIVPGESKMATITKVWLDESENECTMCGACEATCPEVFEVPEKMIVKNGADFTLNDQILESAEGCPVGTIAIEYDNSGKRDNPA